MLSGRKKRAHRPHGTPNPCGLRIRAVAQHSPARAARACCQAVGFTLRRCLPSSEGPMRSEEGPRQLCGKDCLFQHRVSRPSGAFLRLPQRGNAAGEDDPSPPGDLPHRHLLRCLLGISAPSGSARCHADAALRQNPRMRLCEIRAAAILAQIPIFSSSASPCWQTNRIPGPSCRTPGLRLLHGTQSGSCSGSVH